MAILDIIVPIVYVLIGMMVWNRQKYHEPIMTMQPQKQAGIRMQAKTPQGTQAHVISTLRHKSVPLHQFKPITNPQQPRPQIPAQPVARIRAQPIKTTKTSIKISTSVPDVEAKFAKIRKPRISTVEKLTRADRAQIKNLLSRDIHKKMTSMELIHLKNFAVKQGVDDFISQIDSTLNYGENKTLMEQAHGRIDSDNALLNKYNDYEEQANNYYRSMEEHNT